MTDKDQDLWRGLIEGRLRRRRPLTCLSDLVSSSTQSNRNHEVKHRCQDYIVLFTLIESEFDLLMTLDTFVTSITIFYQTFFHLQHYPSCTQKLMCKVGRRSIDKAAFAPQPPTNQPSMHILGQKWPFWGQTT